MAKPSYDVAIEKSRLRVRFAFVSSKIQDVIKVISYDYVGLYHGKKTFNLGFGDFDPLTGGINDNANTANGDVYTVLNTVLNTIPVFFQEYPEHALMVRGSDSGAEFIKQCKPECKKRCLEGECKNQHRRINTYTRYVNNNYDELIKEYSFLGGNEEAIESFEKDKKYDSVFVYKKNANFVI